MPTLPKQLNHARTSEINFPRVDWTSIPGMASVEASALIYISKVSGLAANKFGGLRGWRTYRARPAVAFYQPASEVARRPSVGTLPLNSQKLQARGIPTLTAPCRLLLPGHQ